jgi:hypothetical protein
MFDIFALLNKRSYRGTMLNLKLDLSQHGIRGSQSLSNRGFFGLSSGDGWIVHDSCCYGLRVVPTLRMKGYEIRVGCLAVRPAETRGFDPGVSNANSLDHSAPLGPMGGHGW